MVAIIAISAYIVISVVLYFAMNLKCRKNIVFSAPKNRASYYILSFTWGLPMTLFGCVVALGFIISGHRPKKYGWDWYFEIEGINWGLELGIFFIAPTGDCDYLKIHEHGHGIQNVYLGIFTPLVVSLPSVIRFWVRHFKEKRGEPLVPYDAIWFEGSATESGKALMNRLEK